MISMWLESCRGRLGSSLVSVVAEKTSKRLNGAEDARRVKGDAGGGMGWDGADGCGCGCGCDGVVQ